MRILKDVLKKNKTAVIITILISVTDISVFGLYGIEMEPVIYASVLALFFLLIVIVTETIKEKRKLSDLDYAALSILSERSNLPEPDSASEEKYHEMIELLGKNVEKLTEEYNKERTDSLDYYTAWVHQIKTPIAVLKLKLSEDTVENRAMSAELFRIEQYVDMVLQYIRLGSTSNDLVIRPYMLDDLIKETVRKFAPQFIGKKLSLEYTETDMEIITDKKWFLCILEQILSNAIKYTQSGSVSVSVSENALRISDTGIGIAEEDIPRIFEKGYTGNNGRIGQKSSGLGLYLAKKASDLLNMSLNVESSIGSGSTFTVNLPSKKQ